MRNVYWLVLVLLLLFGAGVVWRVGIREGNTGGIGIEGSLEGNVVRMPYEGVLDNKNKSAVDQLEDMGYVVYGVDNVDSSVMNNFMIIGMEVGEGSENISKQVYLGFYAMYLLNDSKDYYVVELSDEEVSAYFISKGDDLRSFVRNEIGYAEWYARGEKTMADFYSKINQTAYVER